jgi:rhodanese-related sulfurtransferase/predicted transcriptional regulator
VGENGTKQAVFEAVAVMGKALASPVRLQLLDLLAQAPRGVNALAELSGHSLANVSQHLQVLHGAGLVERRREGNHVRYAISGEPALRVSLALADAASAQLAEVERAARSYVGDDTEEVGREELVERLRRGEIVLIDVRPADEFESGHIPGARSIPIGELERRIDELPPDAEVVAYCRGPFCAYSSEAVRRLQARGRRARRLRVGWPEWSLANADEMEVAAG